MMKNRNHKILAFFASACLLLTAACTPAQDGENSQTAQEAVISGVAEWESDSEEKQPAAVMEQPAEYRGMWITYLEWQHTDFSSEEAFRTSVGAMLDNCQKLGINTVIAQVRPFGDALYASDYFPYSHLMTGTQGKAPGFDPLQVLIEEAHARQLRLEAWVNPYRVRVSSKMPAELSADNPAAVWMNTLETASYVHEVNGGLWLEPAEPAVQELIVNGVREIVSRYEVDGIQFDDYFYPEGADDTFDETAYAAYGAGQERGEFRRQNVQKLLGDVYHAVKEENPNVVFGVSPQGNNDNNYMIQYCDIKTLIAQPGYMDYVMPQLYWGYDFVLKSGNDRFAYENCLDEWLSMPRDESVSLYVGLGAYRVGNGDGTHAESSEWQSGQNLSRMVKTQREKGADGFALYRYDSLYAAECADLAQRETENLAALLAE